MVKIYTRSREKGRKFAPIAYYYTGCGLFELDESNTKSFGIQLKVYYNVKTVEEAEEKALE
ncbi:MAG: hypothetical protein ACRD47_16080 [Nitrososphaeraceae archaeon]